MEDNQLTAEELAQLRRLVPLADIIREEAEYRAAQRLVLRTWKRTVVMIASVLGALILLREQLRTLWHWFIS